MKTLLTLTAGMLTLAATTTVQATDSLEHIDRYAVSAQRQASIICWEIRREFRHHARYRHMYRDAYAMYKAASHIREVAHDNDGSPSRMRDLRRDATTLDRKMHHLQGVVEDMRRDLSRRRVRVHGRQRPHVDVNIGHGFSIHLGGGHGHYDVVDWHTADELSTLASLQHKLDTLQRIIGHLQKDLR